MKKIELKPIDHNCKIGQKCPQIEPNITEDSLFIDEQGNTVGFFLKQLPEKASKFANIADIELRSDRVPKSEMRRSSGVRSSENDVRQYSTIIGSVPPKPNMRRNYKSRSSVHNVKTATNFIKAMLLLCRESESIIKEITPELYDRQIEAISKTPKKWRFGNCFTSSISNFNIPAPFHIDQGNLRNTVNVIITKRKFSYGGNLHVPDYGATIDQSDNSILVYPAWRNVHGVTPIVPTQEGGYRNSLVFYPLKSFQENE